MTVRDDLIKAVNEALIKATDYENRLPTAPTAVDAVLNQLKVGARERLTAYMLAAPKLEADGKIHRQGMIAAVLGEATPEHDWNMPHNVNDPTVNGCPPYCPYRLAYA